MLFALAGASVLLAAPAVAQTPSICSKVSASAVSAIVGYTVPAATSLTLHEKPTAQNFGISGLTTICTFGAETNLATLKKDVNLTLEVTSKPLTVQEIESNLAKAVGPTLKVSITSYSGLGVPGIYFTESGAGIRGQGISGLAGTSYFGASVDTTLSKSKLASLAKLAQTL